jgi:hypothetical protein
MPRYVPRRLAGTRDRWGVLDRTTDDYVDDGPQDNPHTWTGTQPEATDYAAALEAGALHPDTAANITTLRALVDAEAAGERFPVPTGPYTAFLLVGACQLTRTHPALSPGLRRQYEEAGRQIQAAFAGTPTFALLERGWHEDGR